MKNIKYRVKRIRKYIFINPVAFFCTFFLGTIGLVASLIQILDFAKVDIPYFKSNPKTFFYLIFIHSVLVGFIALFIRENIKHAIKTGSVNRQNGKKDSILARDLIGSLKTALESKQYIEVIRIGSVLSRPLFISGYYSTRLQIGLLVEEAAAVTNDENEQMKALIDSIGWSYIELGKYDDAEKAIKHGQDIACKLNNKFYISKSYRHMGVIFRRKNVFQKAESNYKKALEYANQLSDGIEKNESLGGIYYALSNLCYIKANYRDALKFIENSITLLIINNDKVRLNLSIIKKADIFLATNRTSEAKDLYRKALIDAETISHRLDMMRCYLGLTKIYISQFNWEKAVDHITKAKEIDVELNSINESVEINELLNKIQKEQKVLYDSKYKKQPIKRLK